MTNPIPPPSQDPAAKRRARLMSYTTKNMVYSVVVVLVAVFAVYALTPNPQGSQRRPAEIEQTARFAATAARWPIWSPQGLGQEWSGTVVQYVTMDSSPTWRLMMVSPRTQSIELRQALDPNDGWRNQSLKGLESAGTTSFDGPGGAQDWQVWTGVSANDEQLFAAVLTPSPEQPATTIIDGTADTVEVAEFIESLQVVEQDPN